MTLGGDAALEDNKARLRELADRTDKLKREKDVISNKIDKLKEDIANQQVRTNIHTYIHTTLFKLRFRVARKS